MKRFTNVVCSIILLLLAFSPMVRAQEKSDSTDVPTQTWTVTVDGKTEEVKGTVKQLADGQLQIELTDGTTRKIDLQSFTEADRKQALADRVGSGVVVIRTHDVFDEPTGRLGSGVLFDSSGLILTNFHVVAGAGSIDVKFRDREQAVPAQLLAVDQKHDVAVLHVKTVPEKAHVLELQLQTIPNPGADVWTIGHPQNLVNTVDWGTVNAKRETQEFPPNLRAYTSAPDDALWLQVDAVIAPGSSGGPLLNETGEVIGICTLKLGPNLGFAAHIARAKPTIEAADAEQPLALPLPPAEDEDPLAWLSREIAPLVKDYLEASEQFEKEAARLPREKAIARYHELQTEYHQKFISLAQKDPESWPALQALCYAAGASDSEQPEQVDKVCDLAFKHHIKKQQMTAILKYLRNQPNSAVREFCKRVADESPHVSVQHNAKVTLAVNVFRWFQNPDSIDLKRIRAMRSELKNLIEEFQTLAEKTPDEEQPFDFGGFAKSLETSFDAVNLGTEALPIKGVDIDGEEFQLSDYRGEVVLLDFFADWCPHCKRMYPHERKMVKDYQKRPFELLGINSDSEKVLQQIVDDEQVTWRCWADGPEGPISLKWKVTGIPTMVLLDHNGIVRWQSSGAPAAEVLDEHVEQLVKEAEADKKK
jgi:S1-C subfamily serine protease/thiol-disulfide isomerase/thioredoxin